MTCLHLYLTHFCLHLECDADKNKRHFFAEQVYRDGVKMRGSKYFSHSNDMRMGSLIIFRCRHLKRDWLYTSAKTQQVLFIRLSVPGCALARQIKILSFLSLCSQSPSSNVLLRQGSKKQEKPREGAIYPQSITPRRALCHLENYPLILSPLTTLLRLKNQRVGM